MYIYFKMTYFILTFDVHIYFMCNFSFSYNY